MEKKYSYIFLAAWISFWFLGGMIILGGFIKESVENDGYTIQVCRVSANTIIFSSNSSYEAEAALEYTFKKFIATKWVLVGKCETDQEAQDYLEENYPLNKIVPCYVAKVNSSDVSIKISLYSQDYTVLAGMIFFCLSIGVSFVYFSILLVERYRRRHYTDVRDENTVIPLAN